MMMKLILGSASKWRKQILDKAGIPVELMSPDIDERQFHDNDIKKLVLKIANAKADALIKKIHEPAILITADQMVVCGDEIFGKPNTSLKAKYFIKCYQKNPAYTITAVVVTNTETKKRISGVDVVEIHFHPIPDDVVDQLICHEDLLTCAGGFQIEDEKGELNPYIKSISGDIDSVKGLPVKLLKELIAQC